MSSVAAAVTGPINLPLWQRYASQVGFLYTRYVRDLAAANGISCGYPLVLTAGPGPGIECGLDNRAVHIWGAVSNTVNKSLGEQVPAGILNLDSAGAPTRGSRGKDDVDGAGRARRHSPGAGAAAG
jgi:hypothetical protein